MAAGKLLERLLLRIEADSSRLDGQLRVAEGKVKTSSRRLSGLIRGVGVGLLAGSAAFAAFGLAAQRAIDKADNIAKTADKIGISTDALQELRFAADLSGVSMQSLDRALTFATKSIGELRTRTDSELVTALRNFDAQLLDNIRSAGSVEEALDLVFKRMGALEDQTKRAALAKAVFGRAGVDLTNIVRGGSAALDQMRQQARDLGIVLDEQLLRNAEKAKDALTILGTVIEAQVTKAVLELGPEIADLAGEMTQLAIEVAKGVTEFAKFFGIIERGSTEKLQRELTQLDKRIALFTRPGRRRNPAEDRLLAEAQARAEVIRGQLEVRTGQVPFGELGLFRKRTPGAVPVGGRVTDRAAAEKQAAANRKIIESLDAQVAAFGRSDRANFVNTALRRLNAKATADQRATVERLAGAIFDETAKQEAANRAQADAKRIFDQTRTPAEALAARLERLNDLYSQGAIDGETYARAVRQARQDVDDFANAAGRAFDDAGDALLDMALRGEASLENLRSVALAVIHDIARAAIRELAGGETGGIGQLIAQGIRGLLGAGGAHINVGGSAAQGGGSFARRQHGGPVRAGQAVLVGERGVELFRPNIGGTIIPNERLIQDSRGGVTVNLAMPIDARRAEPGVEGRIEAVLAALRPQIIAETLQAVVALANEGGNFSKAVGRRRQ